jgi:hypothetical protein
MSLFDSILEKLGVKKGAAPAAPAVPHPTGGHYTPSAATTATAQSVARAAAANQPAPSRPAQTMPTGAPAPVPVVDVVSKLEGLAKKYPMKLNWKESIVDLLVLLDLPHKSEDLKELAVELKCPGNLIDDSFKRNMWLHKTVLKAIADNGGNIPKNLLD